MSADEDWKDEAREPLASLLEGARRASGGGMSDGESARVWERVRLGRPRRTRPVWRAVGVAAALLFTAGVAWRLRPARIDVIKEVAFESVHEGKIVRFEMTVYREVKEEKTDADKPSL